MPWSSHAVVRMVGYYDHVMSCDDCVMSCDVEDGSHGQPYERKLLPKQKEKMEMILDRFNLPQAQSSNEEVYTMGPL